MTARSTVDGLRSMLGVAAGLLMVSLLTSPSPTARADDQADQLISGQKLIIKTNAGDPSKNKLVFVSKDTDFEMPNASNDPTQEGATLLVRDLGLPAGTVAIALIKERWTGSGGSFKYTGLTGDPCKTVKIKDDTLVKVVCKGPSVNLPVPLTGDAALALKVGTASIRYCATFGGELVKNILKNGKGTFKAKSADPPPACLACGDGVQDAEEECDDGNNVSGDCCSASCKLEASNSPCAPDGDPCTDDVCDGSGTCGVNNTLPCDDGNPCTPDDQCDGAGTCVGSGTMCGNDNVEAGCGEQCDGSDDSACPQLCKPDCTCAPQPTCDGDPSRTVYMGGPDTGACGSLTNQALCEQAYHMGQGGAASCFWDGFDCLGCGPNNQSQGLCINTCHPPTCLGDPSRTTFAGGPGTSACHNFDGDQTSCEQAFHIGQYGVASCYYDVGLDECKGCGPNNQDAGDCVDTCADCTEDPTRTIFAGGPNTAACHQFDGDQASCEQAFHRTQCGTMASCWYDGAYCNGCGPNNEQNGECRNTCVAGTCPNDPSRTIFAGGPYSAACHQFDGDPASCQQAYHLSGDCAKPASCYYDFGADSCNGCGPNNENSSYCANTCKSGPVTCENDPSRTVLAGFPGSQGCYQLGQLAGTTACETAFNVGAGGITSCFYDENNDACAGCGPPNESQGLCVNTCEAGATCPNDPTRTIFAGGPGTGSSGGACRQFDGDQASCEAAFNFGMCGVTSCYYETSSDECLGCGPNNQASGDCINTCTTSCPGDPSRTIFAGGAGSGACHNFDGNQTQCQKAYHVGQNGVASCYYDGNADECKGCGTSNQDAGECVNTCPVCADDPNRTVFAGGPGTSACHQSDGNKAACEAAFHYDSCLRPTSCFYDSSTDECRGCGPNSEGYFECVETCRGGTHCYKDPARTIYAGGPNSGACHQFDGDPASCEIAYHSGASGVASCYYDYADNVCNGCGYSNESNGFCMNTCFRGAPTCEQDPSRTTFLGGPGTSACHTFDGNQAACETAFHRTQCGTMASCWYDQYGSCNGCGQVNEENGDCMNTCTTPVCAGDASRTTFTGGPGTGACHQFDGDFLGCIAAYHEGQCGVASCYYDGSSCNGCGLNNESGGSCFNTCQWPAP